MTLKTSYCLGMALAGALLSLVAAAATGDDGAAPTPVADAPAATEAPATAQAALARRVAIFDLRAPGLAEGARAGLMAVLTEAVASSPELDVISRDEIATLLDAEAEKQLLGCDDTGCLAEIAGALDVEMMVAGAVTPLGEGSVITLQLINQRYANVMNRVSLTWPGEPRHLPEAIEAAAQLLVLDGAARTPATVVIGEAPEMAELVLDDQHRCSADRGGQARFEAVAVGVHALRISADGHTAREIPLIARAGDTVRVNGNLEPTPFYATWWFWTGVAVLGAAAVAGSLVVVLWDDRGSVTVHADPIGIEGDQ